MERFTAGVQVAGVRTENGEEEKALALESLTGKVEPGDEVVLNTTAVELGLGSGGYHFVLWNLARDRLDAPGSGHIMKLRYTPLQFNVEAVEERLSGNRGPLHETLAGMPVIAGSLHSQLLPAAFAYHRERPRSRLVYVMTDGGSLPIAFSRTVERLKEDGLIYQTITTGHAFGGDHESVSLFGALDAARNLCGADAAIVLMGPGIVGTGSALGFTGMEQAVAINATASLGGSPIAIARISFADRRARHQGLSHHTMNSLGCGTCVGSLVAIPRLEGEKAALIREQLEAEGLGRRHRIVEVDTGGVLEEMSRLGYHPTVMGRTPDEDPEFFAAACAAGLVAAGMEGNWK